MRIGHTKQRAFLQTLLQQNLQTLSKSSLKNKKTAAWALMVKNHTIHPCSGVLSDRSSISRELEKK